MFTSTFRYLVESETTYEGWYWCDGYNFEEKKARGPFYTAKQMLDDHDHIRMRELYVAGETNSML